MVTIVLKRHQQLSNRHRAGAVSMTIIICIRMTVANCQWHQCWESQLETFHTMALISVDRLKCWIGITNLLALFSLCNQAAKAVWVLNESGHGVSESRRMQFGRCAPFLYPKVWIPNGLSSFMLQIQQLQNLPASLPSASKLASNRVPLIK